MSDYLDKSDMPHAAPEYVVPPDAPLVPRAELVQRALPIAAPAAPGGAGAGAAADAAAARRIFDRYRERLADETRRRQDADLALFASFLERAASLAADSLSSDPAAWAGISWGLVEAFVAWQLQEGYAIGSVNVRLSTVKTYAKLAAKAGQLGAEAAATIAAVDGLRHAAGRRVDRQRATTRVGSKKAAPVSISPEQAQRLKAQDAPRDRLLMCLLLDHGLRVGEVAILTAGDVDRRRGVLRFYRPKVDKQQQHRLSADARAAAEAYLDQVEADAALFPSTRQIARIVAAAGAAIGLDGLSPHDCRHAWATAATRAGTPLKALQDAGGWSSPAMPLRYAESAEIANDGVTLD